MTDLNEVLAALRLLFDKMNTRNQSSYAEGIVDGIDTAIKLVESLNERR